MNDWISVEDRLPEGSLPGVLVGMTMPVAGFVVTVGFYLPKYSKWISVKSAGSKKLNYVTHWMPLPEPPK